MIGSDWLQPGTDIRQWTSKDSATGEMTLVTGERLLNEFDFLVLPRPGYEVADLTAFGPRMRMLKFPDGFGMVESNASSTELRKRARSSSVRSSFEGADVSAQHDLSAMDGLLPPAVLAYIRRHQIFKHLAADFDTMAAQQSLDGSPRSTPRLRRASSSYHAALVTGI